MESQKSFTLTTVLNMLVPSLLISAPFWVSQTTSPYCPQSNGFAEACVKSVKHAFQHAKYSGANPQLATLSYSNQCQAPITCLLLYQCQLRTTIPAKFCNTDPAVLQVCEWIATHSDTFRSQVDKTLKISCTPVCWSASCHV